MQHLAIRLIVSLATFLIGLTATTLLAPLRFDAVADGKAREEILHIESQYIQAHLNRDTALLDEILADEFTIKNRWGRGTTKARRLALLEDPDFAFEAINTYQVEVEVDGDSARLKGRAYVQGRNGDETFTSPTYRFTRHYEKRDGRWQIVSVRVRR